MITDIHARPVHTSKLLRVLSKTVLMKTGIIEALAADSDRLVYT